MGTSYFFFKYLRYKLFISLCLSILVGVLDGFGLSMFMPLLQLAEGSESSNTEGLGNLEFLPDFLNSIGLNLTFQTVLGLMCVFFILKGIILFINHSYLVILLLRFIRKIRFDIIKGVSNMAYKAFVLSDVGRIQNTASSEIGRISKAYKAYFGTIEQLILVVVYISFAFLIDGQFAILVSVGGLLTNFIYLRIYKITKETSKAVTNDSHVFQGLLIQFVASFKYLKATGLLDEYRKKVEQTILYIEGGNKKIGLLNALLISAREPLLIIVVAIVMIIQINVLNAELGPILLSLIFFYRALSSLMAMQNQYNSFLAMSGSMTNMTSFLEELNATKDYESGKDEFIKLNKSLKFKKGFFQYNDEYVLRDIDFEIHKNETVAIIGESGSGKSTMLSIISGLMTLSEGQFMIDDTNIRNISKVDYQSRIGYITQEAVIFNDTIYNNVTLWADKTEENLKRFDNALNKAAIKDFVYQLKVKEETELGNNGINLSGGQKQRISIARELYKNIDILIMDEATSALDSETEKSIQENIDKLKGQYTIVIVAHRLSTVKNADRIVLLNKGRMEAIGTYEVLLDKSSVLNEW